MTIRSGIGGWVFAPWRGTFYPKGVRQADELAYASRHVTAIEINATFYGAQKPSSFQKWFSETPDDFMFSVKGPRVVTQRRELGESGPSIERFFSGGVLELKHKLGPILWQFATRFDPVQFAKFLELLPSTVDGHKIRHVVEAVHESYAVPEFVDLLRSHNVAAVIVESDKHPPIHDVTADFVYARLRGTREDVETGYPRPELTAWAKRFKVWSEGGEPDDAQKLQPDKKAPWRPRDCFVYFISGAKVRAPAAAQAFLEIVGKQK
jgi:uncharacterized protein YecE (DUF72 family)